ncbi:MAG: RagB/SusD family nutrient uptake outer membrane protein [Bacteroidales bacterium]|nr:RagB/SusD family nutrient uptake outer membrane protein [Bacteroidales bacterium]
MKNILIKSIAILSAAFIAAGCIEETFPTGSTVTSEQLEASPNALQYLVNGIPSAMMASGTAGYASSYGYHADFGLPGIHLMTESMLEDFTISGELGYFWFGAFFQNTAMGADYIYPAYFWDCYYGWIKLANDIIARAGEVTDETDQTVINALGQAYAYRAMCYLDLARLYEPKDNKYAPVSEDIKGLTVPIVTEATTEEIAKYNPRADREQMYDFIFSDLQMAEKYLSATDNSYTNPTLGAVYGMYARAYVELGAADDKIDRNAYEKAYEYADLAIKTSGKTPLTWQQWMDPQTGFNSGNSNNSWIWGLTLSVENASNIITNVAHLAPEAVWGYSILSLPSVNKALYDRISYDDFRIMSWLDPEYTWHPGHENYNPSNSYQFAGMDDPLAGFEQWNIYTAYDYFLSQGAAPYVNLKFRPAGGQCVEYTEGNIADHVLMRVEEMYFIRIEAALRKKTASGLDAAKKLLNEFMQTYRYSSYDCSSITSETAFIQEMMLQKRIEFWGEGILFFDYKRLNQGITRGYNGTNFPAVARFNTDGRSPQWNVVITRSEYQSNTALNQELNNPDPTELLVPWSE